MDTVLDFNIYEKIYLKKKIIKQIYDELEILIQGIILELHLHFFYIDAFSIYLR